jgi:hypothetical protein
VYVSDAGSTADANAASELARKALEAQGATEFETGAGTVGGVEAPGFLRHGVTSHLPCSRRTPGGTNLLGLHN